MTHDEKLLCSIHRAAEMGRDSLARVLQSVQNDHFRNLLADWQETYSRYYISADVLLKASGGDDRGLGGMSRVMGDVMTDLSLAMDDSDAHIAEMLHKGTQMGIDELDEQLRTAKGAAQEETLNLASNMLDFLYSCRSELNSRMSERGT